MQLSYLYVDTQNLNPIVLGCKIEEKESYLQVATFLSVGSLVFFFSRNNVTSIVVGCNLVLVLWRLVSETCVDSVPFAY